MSAFYIVEIVLSSLLGKQNDINVIFVFNS